MPLLCEQLQVPVPIDVAFQYFWDTNLLSKFWKSISYVEQIYEDGSNQECLIGVHRNGKEEHIRIIKFRDNYDITFFNPVHPPMMTYHCGAWRFISLSNESCKIIAERNYAMIRQFNESDEAFLSRTNHFQEKFVLRIQCLLQTFHDYICEVV